MESDILKTGFYICQDASLQLSTLWKNYIHGLISEDDYVKAYTDIMLDCLMKLNHNR